MIDAFVRDAIAHSDISSQAKEDALARVHRLAEACVYLAGYDVAGWEPHIPSDEVLAMVGIYRDGLS